MSKVRPHQSAPRIVGSNIATRRQTLRLTQKELGDAIGYSRRQIGRIERGERSLPTEMLPAIAQVLRLTDPLILTTEDAFEEWI